MNRLAGELTAFQQADTRVAVLYSQTAHVFSEEYRKTVLDGHEALSAEGQRVDFVSETEVADGGLEDYDLLVLPGVTHVKRGAIEPLATFADDGGRLVSIGQAPQRDHRDRELPGAARSAVADAATRVPVDASASQLRGAIRSHLDELELRAVVVVDADSGEPSFDVEWRSVEDGEDTLLSVANLASEERSIQITVDGETVESGTELIEERTVDDATQSIPGKTPRIFRV
jgi:hypothetical protein